MKKALLIILVIVISIYLLLKPSIGGNPEGKYLEKILNSPQYSKTKDTLQNPKKTPSFEGDRSKLDILIEVFFEGANRVPKTKLPEDKTGYQKLAEASDDVRFIWFGHSTILIEIDGLRIITDPIFSNYASPIPGMVKRFQPPVLSLDQVDDIDVVLISHDHYDHLDYKTIKQLKGRDIQYIVPIGVGSHLRYWGVDEQKIVELDWWENTQFKGLSFTATPSQHFSGRGLFNENSTLWASWAIQGKQQNLFFSGDSGYSEHYKKIGDRLGPFDLTFLENGAYNLDWKFVHQMPEEGVQANIDLRGTAMVPIHWGMFDLSLHNWDEPILRLSKEADLKGVRVIAPKIGQMVSTNEKNRKDAWWEAIIIH